MIVGDKAVKSPIVRRDDVSDLAIPRVVVLVLSVEFLISVSNMLAIMSKISTHNSVDDVDLFPLGQVTGCKESVVGLDAFLDFVCCDCPFLTNYRSVCLFDFHTIFFVFILAHQCRPKCPAIVRFRVIRVWFVLCIWFNINIFPSR